MAAPAPTGLSGSAVPASEEPSSRSRSHLADSMRRRKEEKATDTGNHTLAAVGNAFGAQLPARLPIGAERARSFNSTATGPTAPLPTKEAHQALQEQLAKATEERNGLVSDITVILNLIADEKLPISHALIAAIAELQKTIDNINT